MTTSKPELTDAQAELTGLDRIRAPNRVQVGEIAGGRQATQMLAQLGVRAGQVLEVRRAAPLGGPILVEADGSVVAVGRGLARKVLVRVLG